MITYFSISMLYFNKKLNEIQHNNNNSDKTGAAKTSSKLSAIEKGEKSVSTSPRNFIL